MPKSKTLGVASPLRSNPEFLADCKSEMLKKDIMAKWGVSSGLVVDVRKELRGPLDEARMKLSAAEQAVKHDKMILEYVDDRHDPVNGSSYTRMADTAWGEDDWREFLRQHGTDPDSVLFSHGVTSRPDGGYWNKLNNVRPKKPSEGGGPAWPVIRHATPVLFPVVDRPARPARDGLKLSLKCADTQIGFRILSDGTIEEFHDWSAMEVFVEVCRREQPESIVILGDFLDLPSQSRWAQEAGFARTTQMALDAGYLFLSMLRSAVPDAQIILVEGNHDKRMQTFIETNALAAFGLRRGGMPKEWPVMSLQNLLRLDELRVEYMDAYPAATHWDNDTTRNIHGTRANSKGSTTSQYSQELPHISTWVGHTHRTEITYKTVIGPRGEPIESYTANPGCLCKTDGTVPSVHGAIHSDGRAARIVEDWQQGFGSLLYNDAGEAWPNVHRIRDGRALYRDQIIGA